MVNAAPNNPNPISYVNAKVTTSDAERAFMKEGKAGERYSRLQFDGLDTRFAVRVMTPNEASVYSAFGQSHRFVQLRIANDKNPQLVNVNSLAKRLLVDEASIRSMAKSGALEKFVQERVDFLKANKELLDKFEKSSDAPKLDRREVLDVVSSFAKTKEDFASNSKLEIKEFYANDQHSFKAIRRSDQGIDVIYSKDRAEPLGKGSFGQVDKVYNLTQGTFEAYKKAATVPSQMHIAVKGTKKEHDTLVDIHKGAPKEGVRGIQTPPHALVYNEKSQQAGYLGKLYAEDGQYWLTGSPTPQQRLQVVNDLVHGYAHLSKLDYWHSDIKPGNCLITDKGGAVLADWGGAIPLNKGDATEEDFSIVFSPKYVTEDFVTAVRDHLQVGQRDIKKLNAIEKLEKNIADLKAKSEDLNAQMNERYNAWEKLPKLEKQLVEQYGNDKERIAEKSSLRISANYHRDEIHKLAKYQDFYALGKTLSQVVHGERSGFTNKEWENVTPAYRAAVEARAAQLKAQVDALPESEKKAFREVTYEIDNMTAQQPQMFAADKDLGIKYRDAIDRWVSPKK